MFKITGFLVVFLSSQYFVLVDSHAKFLEPPSRASMWRRGFDTPKNYDDNQGYCGGRVYQKKLKGKCGICGDPWDAKVKDHEAPGGKYAKGIIVRKYEAGQKVKVTIDMDANHKGYFEFKLCVNNNLKRDKQQDCFDKNVLEVVNGKDKKYYVPSGNKKMYPIVKLPKGLVCDHCILQWTYVTGNCWECKKSEKEHFRNCADIKIIRPKTTPSRTTTTERPSTKPKGCKYPEYKGDFSCDDGNNSEECDWDGGDCCGSEVDKQFCKDCQCKDPTISTSPTTTSRPATRTPTFAPRTPTPSGICEFPGYKKDGACDDLSNNVDCNWDGGDCCGPEVNTELCLDCECLDPKYSSAIAPFKEAPEVDTTPNPNEGCEHSEYTGDGICDDLSNSLECDWDGGDCCGDEVDTNYCVDCDCKDPAFAGLAKLTGSGENTISNFTNVHNQFQKYYEQKRLYLQSEGELPENEE